MFAALGPHVSWDYIGKISASIPCQRKVKDHIEQSINKFCQGKSHTSPSKEDVMRLQSSYCDSKVHQKIQGRKLDSKYKTKDYVSHGMQGQSLMQAINRWSEHCVKEWSSEEYWEECMEQS